MLRRILLLFFASGALGLGYQVLWSKLVLLFVGVSSWSYAIVLAAFMAGLALGSRLLGGVADRARSPLALFGWLELGVGAYAVAYPALSEAAGRLYLRLAAAGVHEAGDPRLLLLKAAVAGALLIPPTFLMGGTYPALVRHASVSLGSVGRRASQLYAVNAAGAVVGSLGMAMIVLPAFGIRASLMLLALGNASIGLLALAASRRAAEAPERGTVDLEIVAPPEEGWTRTRRLAAIVAFVAGFLSFTLEIAWTRAFAVVTGSSTQSFAVILAAFITGIAAGSAILSRVESRIGRPLAAFGAVQVATAALVLLPMPLVPYLPWILGRLARGLPATDAGYQAWGALKLGACLLVMLLPCLGMGLSIPLVVKAVARGAGTLGADTGRVYAFNTLGNVLGALSAGMVLLPILGVQRLVVASAVALAVAGMATVALERTRAARGSLRLVAAGCGLVVLLALLLPRWNTAWMSVASFRRDQIADWAATRVDVSAREVVYDHDDPAANVTVLRWRREGPEILSLLVNGKPDASNHGDQPTQLLLAHLPMALRPDARSVLVVGLATGITCGAVLQHPIERLHVVDVVRSMPRAAALFDEWSGRPLADPRTRFIADDARSWLMSTTERYDVVISEPSNPWTAGTGSLFSTEFYAEASRHLAPGGTYVQWLQAYELSDENLGAILRSFRTVFPHVTLWETTSLDVLLVGSSSPLRPDPARLAEVMQRPGVSAQLATLGLRRPDELLFLQRFTEPVVDWLASASELENTDDNLLLEHEAPRDLFLLREPRVLTATDERASVGPALEWTGALRSGGGVPLALPALMAGRTFGSSHLLGSWVAALRRIPSRSSEAERIQLPPAMAAAGSAPAESLVRMRLGAGVQRGDIEDVARALGEERTAILLQSAMDPPSAASWSAELETLASGASGRMATLLRLMRFDVLASAGRREDAVAVLAGASSWESPPHADEVLLRLCRLDDAELCTRTARDLLAASEPGSDQAAHLARFVELRTRD